jgi:hypothetical protein
MQWANFTSEQAARQDVFHDDEVFFQKFFRRGANGKTFILMDYWAF